MLLVMWLDLWMLVDAIHMYQAQYVGVGLQCAAFEVDSTRLCHISAETSRIGQVMPNWEQILWTWARLTKTAAVDK